MPAFERCHEAIERRQLVEHIDEMQQEGTLPAAQASQMRLALTAAADIETYERVRYEVHEAEAPHLALFILDEMITGTLAGRVPAGVYESAMRLAGCEPSNRGVS